MERDHGYEIVNREPYVEEIISNNISYNESTIGRIERMKNFSSVFYWRYVKHLNGIRERLK